MKNKFKFVLMNLIVLIILLSSNFQAKNTVKIENEEEPTCLGIIHGSVGNSRGLYYWEPYIFAKVDAEVKQTRTGLLGCFRFLLPLNREYKITAYKSGFKPMTKEIYLSETYPVREVTFDFFESETENIKSIEDSKPVFYGFIFGITGGVFEHAQWFVPQTKLTFENRTISSGRFYGFYIIFFLQIGKKYTITAHKDGYLPTTKTVILTLKKPIQLINFFMYED